MIQPRTAYILGLVIMPMVAPSLALPTPHSHTYTAIAKRSNIIDSLISILVIVLGFGGKLVSSGVDINTRPQVTMPDTGKGRPIRNNLDIEATIVHYAGYAEGPYELTGKSWSCQTCQKPEFQGTIVDVYWENAINGSTGYIAHNPKEKLIVISFRGSKELSDWRDSLNIDLVPWPASIPGSQVMAGVHEGYASLEPRIIPYVASLAERYPDYAILATGHSLGGSRASLCALDLSIQHPQLVSRLRLYTYGIPKLGNSEFANAINRLEIPAYRAVNRGDIAAHLPPDNPEYVHFGTEVWFQDGNVTLCYLDRRGQCSDTLSIFELSIYDHSSYPGM
ncbi:alpha/beta-hydrolase [Linderina pennispora]|uniref:Alpha/beta-hydrolase n=1 Tax=Linderina pennispora TaxID=61395 RepID=A0A1Y1W502_9FUNG|nr:alpha/beta-hydrolase [Linderina pennispora]ORX68296.1 alpha/beta-hydrolase [Linderina pennispora]